MIYRRTLSVACVFFALVASAQATPLFSFSAGEPDTVQPSLQINIGNAFVVGASSLTTTQIGAWVNQAGGTTTTVPYVVSLYSIDPNALTATLISSTDIPIGTHVDAQGFAYQPLSTTLSANDVYGLTDAATTDSTYSTTSTTPFGYNGAGGAEGTWLSSVTFAANIFNFSATPNAAPNSNNPSFQEFMGANLIVTPEPSSLILCGLGVVGLVAAARRRKV